MKTFLFATLKSLEPKIQRNIIQNICSHIAGKSTCPPLESAAEWNFPINRTFADPNHTECYVVLFGK